MLNNAPNKFKYSKIINVKNNRSFNDLFLRIILVQFNIF